MRKISVTTPCKPVGCIEGDGGITIFPEGGIGLSGDILGIGAFLEGGGRA